MSGELLIAVAIRDATACRQVIEQIDLLRKSDELDARLKFTQVEVQVFVAAALHADLEIAEEALDKFYATNPTGCGLLISDSLVDDGKPAEAALHLSDKFFDKALGTIGFTGDCQRVAEIDRVLPLGATAAQLRNALELVAARLRYISPPSRQTQKLTFTIRRIQYEYELQKYFRLRFQVYSTMGYLDPRKERVPSQMEIDGSDASAVHYGAFCQIKGREQLAGAFRILLAEAGETIFAEWTRNLLDSDHQLRSLVAGEQLPLRLPIFQSQQLDDELYESIRGQLLCAELSRVIVAEAFRGLGLSKLLVREAQQESLRQSVHNVYLECLRAHEPLYRCCGFETLPGKSGRVLGMNRTMIAMRQRLRAATPAPAPAAAIVAQSP
jgi:predicted GNAT family N-acyltransferase